jgi:hypothetical protein
MSARPGRAGGAISDDRPYRDLIGAALRAPAQFMDQKRATLTATVGTVLIKRT